ncbi:MAG: hypothetical protein QGF71_09080, partial [Rhodospirillales bacterium]|nr:hypothetical protein [Rhodospirillales bacterium]
YHEAGRLMKELAIRHGHEKLGPVIDNATSLNGAAVNQPGNLDDLVVNTGSNVYEIYRDRLHGQSTPLSMGRHSYRIERANAVHEDLAGWFREVVWFGNKKGAYLFPIHPQENFPR